jgi:nucleoside-diphosphate-sugar epimerase
MAKRVAVAGATGNLGNRIVKALVTHGADVLALARKGSDEDKVNALKTTGGEVALVDLSNAEELSQVLRGAACVISAVQGLRDVIIDAQTALLEGAIKASVPRCIPSDFSTDFRKRPAGENRNFDLRREFHKTLDRAPISATSIFNGAFTDILTYNVPFFDSKKKMVGYWDDPDWHVDFTTMDDTAAYTAAAALDAETPKALCIASFQVSARDLAEFTKNVLGTPFELINLGSLQELAEKNKRDRAEHPEGETQLYASWQSGQYLQSMFSSHHESLDNGRYPQLTWTKLENVIKPAV